jgi:UDP-glucose 4-epimerase
VEYYNVGTGNGYSVLDMVHAYERVTGLEIPYQIVDRRPGDIDECYADPALAEKMLGWRAEFDLDDMCRDAHRWQSQNPDGYPDEE